VFAEAFVPTLSPCFLPDQLLSIYHFAFSPDPCNFAFIALICNFVKSLATVRKSFKKFQEFAKKVYDDKDINRM
jgi:hypothetical protein